MKKRKTTTKTSVKKPKAKKTVVKKAKTAVKKTIKKVMPKKSTVKKPAASKRKAAKSNGFGLLTPAVKKRIVSLLTELEDLLNSAEKKVLKKLS